MVYTQVDGIEQLGGGYTQNRGIDNEGSLERCTTGDIQDEYHHNHVQEIMLDYTGLCQKKRLQ